MMAHAPFACEDAAAGQRDFFARHNPMAHYEGIRVPTLVVNSADDIVCLERNIPTHLAAETGWGVLLKTKRGAHVAYCEGWAAEGSYLLPRQLGTCNLADE
jgi:predicted alpha/beta-fold hydrolase